MSRCASAAFAALIFCTLVDGASAQMQRAFPATALRGTLVVTEPPQVTLNGQSAQLAPGARIRGQDNLIKVPGSLLGTRLPVHYTVDNLGLLQDVWILRDEESAKRPWPTTVQEAQRWSFDPVSQTWTRP